MTWTCSWRTHGNNKTLTGAALFSDLSVLWYKVDWDMSQEHLSGFTAHVQKQARYLDRPEPFAAEDLWYACSTYGEQVALFAEGAERQGRPVGHGEWTVFSESLKKVLTKPHIGIHVRRMLGFGECGARINQGSSCPGTFHIEDTW